MVQESLSALLDDEFQPVPRSRLDGHLEVCGGCRQWLLAAATRTRALDAALPGVAPDLADRILAAASIPAIKCRPRRVLVKRFALTAVGAFQIIVALAQLGGIDFGMVAAHAHGAETGAHLMHESTAWLLALGAAMVAAGFWPAAAVGVTAIVGVFAVGLTGYVVADAYSGQVTAARTLSHVPVLLGMVFSALVAWDWSRPGQAQVGNDARNADDAGIGVGTKSVSPARRRHLRPVNQARKAATTAATTIRRSLRRSLTLRWETMAPTLPPTPVGDDAVTALALAAGRGDRAALEAFVKATQHDVWRFVAYLFNAGSADDLTQETFLRAMGALPRFSGQSGARTWLLSIARRVVADHIRYLQSRPRSAPGVDPARLLEARSPSRGFEDLVEVRAMIADLTVEQREALLLTQLLGLSYRDAATVCGCPVGTIRSRVARARGALLAEPERDNLTG